MNAKVISLAKVRASSIYVADNHESIRESYRFLTRPNGKPLSTQDKQVLDLVSQLIKSGTRCIDYPWIQEKICKSKKTLNRTFKNISLYFICKFKNKHEQENKEFFNKIVLTETTECQNSLDEALTKLASSRYKKGDKSVHRGGQKCPQGETKVSTPLLIYKRKQEKEIEDSPYRAISSISREEIKNKEKFLTNEPSLIAALPFGGSSNNEVLPPANDSAASKQEFKPVDLPKASKPRLTITAAMQQGITPMPSVLQVSGLAMNEGITTTAESAPSPTLQPAAFLPNPVIPLLTAKQERERERMHSQRAHNPEENSFGATILSLLARCNPEANEVTETQEKGGEFQPEVENFSSNDTPAPSITTGIGDKLEEQTQPANTNDTELQTKEVKMGKGYPELRRIIENAIKTYERDVDQWGIKFSLGELEPELDEEAKTLTLTGHPFNINDLETRHYKTFLAAFHEELPGYEFKFVKKQGEYIEQIGQILKK